MSDMIWERRLRVTAVYVNPADRSATIKVEGFKGMDAYSIKEDDALYVFTKAEVDEFQKRYDDLWDRFRNTREQGARYKRHFKELKLLMEEE